MASLPADARDLLGLGGSPVVDALWRRPLGTLATTAVRWALGQARLADGVDRDVEAD